MPPSETTTQKPGFFQLDRVLEEISRDDQDEWEYEYSATETETYYLTLDLSHPDFKEQPRRAHHYRRGVYHRPQGPDRAEADGVKTTVRKTTVPEEATDQEGEADEDGDQTDQGTSAKPQGKGKDAPPDLTAHDQAKDDPSLRDIQVLDLHAQHPLICYRGRYFEGDWAEVIGTEALLLPGAHPSAEPNAPQPAVPSSPAPLPVLRQLPDDVSLLAMSASRILTRERTLRPPATATTASLEPIRKEYNIRIPVGKDNKRNERRDQARFLENLMAVKKKRGEGDLVTVYARAPGEEGKGKERARETTTRPRGARGRVGKRAGRVVGGGKGGRTWEGSALSTPTPLAWESMSTPSTTEGTGSRGAGPSGREGSAREPRDDDGDDDDDVLMTG